MNDELTRGDMHSKLNDLQGHYRSGTHDLGAEFFDPCLSNCISYRRAVAYFSSSALLTWSGALSNLVESETATIALLISPELSQQDLDALTSTLDENRRAALRSQIADKFVEQALETKSRDELTQWRIDLFSWMVANERLTVRFAFPKHVSNAAIFHEKIGVFEFPDGQLVAFTGSANETAFGYRQNYESIDVYRSWVPADYERVLTKEEQFEEAWHGDAPGLEVKPLSEETLKKVKTRAPSSPPPGTPPTSPGATSQDVGGQDEPEIDKWRHQDEAIESFLENKRGVLEMATGTGKTRTAMRILQQLLDSGEVNSAIVATKGTDLLDQWRQTVDQWAFEQSNGFRVHLQYNSQREIPRYARNPENSILIISRQQLDRLFTRLSTDVRDKILMIHDEVHGLGAPSYVRDLGGEHSDFEYVLGLTATPEREYDDEGNEFIEDEVGKVVYQFGLKEAIRRGILCEFDYVPLEVELTDDDRQRLKAVFRRKAASEAEGKPMSDKEMFIALSRVYKTAERKPEVFQDYVSENPEVLRSTIVFVETKAYGERFLAAIQNETYKYRTYYGDDERKNLVDFANGKIDCLITCHRISEGIDVPGLENVVLISSSRAQLETIQRIGRCLRTDPNDSEKRARVIDFIIVKETEPYELLEADAERKEWLSDLSTATRKER